MKDIKEPPRKTRLRRGSETLSRKNSPAPFIIALQGNDGGTVSRKMRFSAASGGYAAAPGFHPAIEVINDFYQNQTRRVNAARQIP